jgi:hypothetical protein
MLRAELPARVLRRPVAAAKDFPVNRARLDNVMNERLAILLKARERMIEDRDPFAKVLAGPPDRDRSERARTRFVELQNLIEAIERAIRSEQQSAEVAAARPTPQ